MSTQDELRSRLASARLEPAGSGQRLALAIGSVVLLAWSFSGGLAGVVALFALVPWLLAAGRASRSAAIVLGAFAGMVYGAATALWIPEALQSLGASQAGSIAGWIAVSAWVEPAVFVPLALLARETRDTPAWVQLAALSGTTFVLEWLLSSAWWGVPWALLGYSQRDVLGVAQLAVVAGVPGISALLVGVNVSLGGCLQRREHAGRLTAALGTAWGALAFFGLPTAEALRPEEPAGPIEVLVIQPDIPRGERWGDDLQPLNLSRVRRFVNRTLAEEAPGIDAIVLPENLLTSPLDAEPTLEVALRSWVDQLRIPLLTGLTFEAEPGSAHLYRSAAAWVEPGRGVTARLDKERAVPLLESARRFPGDEWLASLFGETTGWKKVQEGSPTGPMAGPIPVVPILCYEALFPSYATARRSAGTVAIFNLADDGWVEGDATTRHLTAIARFRAIEQRATLVRLAHGGLSVVVDPLGRVVERLPMDRYASLRLSLSPTPPPTAGERATLLALPLGASLLVWWLGGVGTRLLRRRVSMQRRRLSMMRCAMSLALMVVLVSAPSSAETVGTFTLDGLSYVSFQDEEVLPLATGTIRFHFGDAMASGSVPFTIAPEDVTIPEIALPRGGTLSYELASSVSGLMQPTELGRKITFTAPVSATFREDDHEGTLRYAVLFTTEVASSSNHSGNENVEAWGMRVVDGVWYARIVGATANGVNAEPKPDTAVYTVLSGQFDRLP